MEREKTLNYKIHSTVLEDLGGNGFVCAPVAVIVVRSK